MGKIKLYKEERAEVARFMRRLYRQGLTTTSGGNISLRIDNDIIAITPSATDKGRMRWSEVALVGLDGRNLTDELKPSMETGMHLRIYTDTTAKAIVHAHPVFATSFTAMSRKIDTNLTAEACVILGEPVFVPYAVMGSSDLAEKVSENAKKAAVLLLENHGILATGDTLLQAFDRVEVLETAAKMTVIVRMTGGKRTLSTAEVNELKKLF